MLTKSIGSTVHKINWIHWGCKIYFEKDLRGLWVQKIRDLIGHCWNCGAVKYGVEGSRNRVAAKRCLVGRKIYVVLVREDVGVQEGGWYGMSLG